MFLLQFVSLLFISAFLCTDAPSAHGADAAVFRFHLSAEPHTLDPSRVTSYETQYLFPNLYRGLYRYTNQSLLNEGAKKCWRPDPLKLICDLRKDFLWSDGRPVEAKNYVMAFQRLFSPDIKSTQQELIFTLKNAKKIFNKEAPVSELGIKAIENFRLQFDFEVPDYDFEYKLALPLLAPIRALEFPDKTKSKELLVTGPFQIAEWLSGQKISLVPNPYYQKFAKIKHATPNVEILVLEEDSTAMRLFEKGDLHLLKKVPFIEIPTFEKKPGFIRNRTLRFDYLSFGPEVLRFPQLSKALSLALDYKELQKLFHTPGLPGCPSLPRSFYDHYPCIKTDLAEARKIISKLPAEIKEKRFILLMSQLGGDDHKTTSEWMQNQWKKNLGLKIEIEMTDQKSFLSRLRMKKADIFRKGLSLDRPSCLSALENFVTEHPENYPHFANQKFDQLINEMSLTQSAAKRRKLCQKATVLLLEEPRLIPLGELYFSLMAQGPFRGWHLNEINQLDLTDLEFVKNF
jgi:ABC-type oligopeptide transport system substrate-binding subunit